jgi:hypothetical protein
MKSIKYLCYVLIALSCPLVMAIYHANGRDETDLIVKKIYDALNPAGVFVSFHGGLTHERTGPDRMLLGMILDELMGWGCMIDQGFIADFMLQAGFKSVRSRTLETDWGPMDLDVGRK